MQFVEHGPDIPERLLQAHEDGQVVFFCGTGISYPAGLPGFAGLVNKIYTDLGATMTAPESSAFKKKAFDATLDLLEQRYPGNRFAVRSALARSLVPKLRRKHAKRTHESILQLSTDRKKNVKLVTTNVDDIFTKVSAKARPKIPEYCAPLLPIPKEGKWHGTVYLHGKLPDTPTESGLNKLVFTSGDFGLAYLIERWASRFVTELFRNYTVCFVGYSINDPVLRYMMDAIAADRLFGINTPVPFAFGSYNHGGKDKSLADWKSKGVIPILYETHHNHSALHDTLYYWANNYRDGIRGKERIVLEYARALPTANTKEDDFVSRLIWAINDPSGLPAKQFAEMHPAPSLEWLKPFCEEKFATLDLIRFGVSPGNTAPADYKFSLVSRPAPFWDTSNMTLVKHSDSDTKWDEIMCQLANWLLRHLNNTDLLIWVAKNGAVFHPDFSRILKLRLQDLLTWENAENQEKMETLRKESPNAIPSAIMRTLWKFALNDRFQKPFMDKDLYSCLREITQVGLSASNKITLIDLLTPRISIREPFLWGDDENDPPNWEFELTATHVHSAIDGVAGNDVWKESLPDLLFDFTALLKLICDMGSELGSIDNKSDKSYMSQPSISEHTQNKTFKDWTALIGLCRDAWLNMHVTNRNKALLCAEYWWSLPYPIFKRLSLFAASNCETIEPNKILRWLLSEKKWWLWSTEVEREVLQLLSKLPNRLSPTGLRRLEFAVLAGPPRKMFIEEIEADKWDAIVDRNVWLRLAKIQQSVQLAEEETQMRYQELSEKNPNWQLLPDAREEFPFWMGDGSEFVNFTTTPRARRKLAEWLRDNPSSGDWEEDDWRHRCREDFPTTSTALCMLTRDDIWPVGRWREALQAWSIEKHSKRSWRYMAPVVTSMPADILAKLAQPISWWLKSVAKILESREDIYFSLCSSILQLSYDDEIDIADPVSRAINHPIGHITGSLLDWWFRQPLEDNQLIAAEIRPFFKEICNTELNKYVYGRNILATHVVPLYRVDPEWTRNNLLPLFEWGSSMDEALVAWHGYLRSPRIYHPLLAELRGSFLETANHYEDLGDCAEQYASFLTFIALDPNDIFSYDELRIATQALPKEGLHYAVNALVSGMESTGNQNIEYWDNRIVHYIKSIWPHEINTIIPSISEGFARLCVGAKERFPQALELLRNWLAKHRHPGFVVHRLLENDLCTNSPEPALEFLSIIINTSHQCPPEDLRRCLDQVVKQVPRFQQDARYLDLDAYLRRHNK